MLTMDNTCPHCQYEANRVSHPNELLVLPKDGDFNICIKCGKWSIFSPDGLRLPTLEEYVDLSNNPDAQRLQNAWIAMNKERDRAKSKANS